MIVRSRHVQEWRTIVAVLMSALVVMTMITFCVTTEYDQEMQPIIVQQGLQQNDDIAALRDMAEMFMGLEYGGK